ncbi:SRPBCC family protein [Motilibacter deserti]|uniref:SRPBCC domain-containing protein n=1 Tax=Motilibacter deserti TaxID=2714956 RepID=A0ABX0H3C9_9ACTN|nr:SRPBCC domain-containing protein [Motilibacter deserti]NHC16539.1 SRPBCC domain-containing protein [Motilibacter deserti]
MTTPDVPLRGEKTIELPGTPEQVWQAIATAEGLKAWMVPAELEEREGGAVRFELGVGVESRGTVTGWDPPRRLEYSEPDWATMGGPEDAVVTPLVSEFLIEARSGGTCVLRVVSSAFGTGADWEREYFEEMMSGWLPMLDTLRLYLEHFPGQRAAYMNVQADLPGGPEAVNAALRGAVGADAPGQSAGVRGHKGEAETVTEGSLLLRVSDPVPGFLNFYIWPRDDGITTAGVTGYLYGEDAAGYVEREEPEWKAWLQGLAVPAS